MRKWRRGINHLGSRFVLESIPTFLYITNHTFLRVTYVHCIFYQLRTFWKGGFRLNHYLVAVEPEVCARQRVNQLHRFEREPMLESAE
jgi:hypothetical protein